MLAQGSTGGEKDSHSQERWLWNIAVLAGCYGVSQRLHKGALPCLWKVEPSLPSPLSPRVGAAGALLIAQVRRVSAV